MQSRQSRMEKYYDKGSNLSNEEHVSKASSRTKRNQELYREVSYAELEGFDLNSNVSVIGENTDNISLDEIKDILSEKYRENPRKKSFGDTEEIALPKINLDETREYDINSILEKAKEKKEVNYEEDRLKKIRNTQYDILKNLDIMNNEEEIEENDEVDDKPTSRRPAPKNEKGEKQLLDLIDTITAKELIDNESSLEVTGEMDPLDILSDLRGDDENTKVMGALAQEVSDEVKKKEEDTLGIEPDAIASQELDDQAKSIEVTKQDLEEELEKSKEKKSKKDKKLKLDDSFIGSTTTFSQSDFDDFNDLKEDMHVAKIILKILIFVVVIAFIAGCIILADKFLGLGLF